MTANTTKNFISVIIPCYNTDQEIHSMTEEAVQTITEALPLGEIIIVDNNSTFGGGFLREKADLYIRNKENIGYPAAVNQGITMARGNVICIANNDIRVPNNIFEVGLHIFENSAKNTGSVHYKMIPYSEPFSFGEKIWFTGKERWCTSSFFLIKREALPSGFYDLNYGFGGYDDWDLWHRVRHINGWKTVYTNKSCYQHYGSWTLSKIPDALKSTQNREYFRSKFDKYAEEIWAEKYPDQMSADYYGGFE